MPNPSDNLLKAKNVKVGLTPQQNLRAKFPDKPEAWVQGYEEGIAVSALPQFKNAETALLKTASEFKVALDNEMKTLEPQVIELALAIAKSVLHREIEKGGYNLEAIVTEVLAPLKKGDGPFTVQLNPEDHKTLTQNGTGGPWPEVQLAADPSVPKASCSVKTPYGKVMRQADTIFEDIERAMRGEKRGPS